LCAACADLRDTVPSILLGEALDAPGGSEEGAEGGSGTGGAAPKGAAPRVRANFREQKRGTLDGALEQFSGRKPPAPGATVNAVAAPAAAPIPTAAAPAPPPKAAPIASEGDTELSAEAAAAKTAALQQQPQLRLVDMLGRLTYSASRESIDSWAADFVMLNYNTRPNRERLAKLIVEGDGGSDIGSSGGGAAAGGADVLPYLARLTAVLTTGVKEFGPAVTELVSKEFMRSLRPGTSCEA
jgi:hypothetical protein